MTTQTVTPVIPAGQSLSDAVDCSTGQIVRLTMPPEFTSANLTFQVSSDGNFFNDLYDVKGDEVTLCDFKKNTSVVILGLLAHSIGFLKIRSGTRAQPVPQEAQREFGVTINTAAAAA